MEIFTHLTAKSIRKIQPIELIRRASLLTKVLKNGVTGWGWVVVAASFVINLIADGATFSFGVVYVELLDYFKESRGYTAWIGGLFMAVPLISGPLASSLTDRYGCRNVTIVGSILAALGFILSSISGRIALRYAFIRCCCMTV